MKKTVLAVLALLVATLPTELPSREWTDVTGKFSIEAEFVSFRDGKVELKTGEGKLITLPVEKLSLADQKHVQSLGTPTPKHRFQKLVVYDAQFVKDATGEKFGIVARIRATRASSFKKPGLKLTFVMTDKPLKSDLVDMEFIERSGVLDQNGLAWRFRAPKSGVNGRAQSMNGIANWYALDGVFAMAFDKSFFESGGLALVLHGAKFEPTSNTLILRKEDFKAGNFDKISRKLIDEIESRKTSR